MRRTTRSWYQLSALLLIMALVAGMLVACGDDDEATQPATPETQPATPETQPATPKTPDISTEPVKIGASIAWSGSMGMSGILADKVIGLVQHQVSEMGGILGGRELQIVKCDTKSTVADAAACAKKLSLDKDISALVFGGVWGADNEAVSDVAEQEQMLFVSMGSVGGLPEKKFTVNCAIRQEEWGRTFLDVASNILHAKTVGFLSQDMSDNHLRIEQDVKDFDKAGIKTVYKQYVAPGTTDLSPYLTRIKYENPDVVVTELDSESYVALGKQIQGLGGWGNIHQIHMTQASGATKSPGIEGSYIAVAWVPGLDNPGTKKFEQDYQALYGKAPDSNHVYFYLALWTAINAIEMADTDANRVAIAEACRSGKLQWETPCGLAGIMSDGSSNLRLTVVHVENGKMVPVNVPH